MTFAILITIIFITIASRFDATLLERKCKKTRYFYWKFTRKTFQMFWMACVTWYRSCGKCNSGCNRTFPPVHHIPGVTFLNSHARNNSHNLTYFPIKTLCWRLFNHNQHRSNEMQKDSNQRAVIRRDRTLRSRLVNSLARSSLVNCFIRMGLSSLHSISF